MAKKGYTPAVRYLRYHLAHTDAGVEDSHYIDLAEDLSRINRRMYRQGKVYRIANVTIHSTSNAFIKMCAAPDSWVVRNAWKRGFGLWNKMNRGPGRVLNRYHDYKVRLIDDARTDVDTPHPIDSGNNIVEAGEWIHAAYVTPDGTATSREFTVHLLGPHVGALGAETRVGLVKSYAEARGTVVTNSPTFDDQGDDDALTNLFDDGTTLDEIASNIDTHNDATPYSFGATSSDRGESYPGSDNQPKPIVFGITSVTTAQSIGYVTGFNAICGLLEIETFSDVPNDTIEVLIELAPGDYKGVAAYAI